MAKDAKAAMSMQEKLYQWLDTFHNTEPERHPSRTGCFLTFLMIPVLLAYTIYWFIDNQSKPPTETLVIDWSVTYGPYPMKVQCYEASCWLYLSGCSSDHSARCVALAAGEEMEVQMCYSLGAREGLHVWWSGSSNSSGLKMFSQAKGMWMNQKAEAGRSSLTYVKTEDRTQEEGTYERLRHEWFAMYLSSEVLNPGHSGCQEHRSGAQAAQIVMRPEFYEKTIERQDFFVSLIGEVGGAYGIVSTVFFGLYILLWNLEFGYNHREDIANSLGHHEAKAEAKALTEVRLEVPVEKPEKVPDKLPEKAPIDWDDDDLVMEPRKEAVV